MRTKFKKNYNNPQTYMILGILVAFIVLVFIDYNKTKEWSQMVPLLIILFPVLMVFRGYSINDNYQLTGNGLVFIPMVFYIEERKSALKVLYRKSEGGRVYTRTYYPVDKKAMIDELLKINPEIKVTMQE